MAEKATEKRKRFVADALNKMFEICGSEMRYEDAVEASKSHSEWYLQQQWTPNQREVWKQWFISEILKRKIVPTTQVADREFDWFDLAYGPKINYTQEYETTIESDNPDKSTSNRMV